MAKRQTDTQLKNDEFTKIFDEYRARIEEITKKTTDDNVPLSKDESQYVIDSDNQRTEEIIAKKQSESDIFRAEVEWQANKEAAEIIEEAKLQAQQLLVEAEEIIKKEAKKKTQSQIEKIIEKSKKESEELISQARQAAERGRSELIDNSKQEVEQLIQEITEKCREESLAQSSQIIIEAREKAEQIISGLVTSSAELSKTITAIMKKAQNTISEFENEIQLEVGELTEAIAEAQNILEEATTSVFRRGETGVETEEAMAIPSDESTEIIQNTVLSVRLMGEKSNGKKGSQPLYTGQVELKSISSFEYRHLKELMNYLANIPGIKYVQENASEKEMSVLFNVKEPIPLLDIFSDIPLVDEVVEEGDGISLILKNHS